MARPEILQTSMVNTLTLQRVAGFTPLPLATYSPTYSQLYAVQEISAKYKFLALYPNTVHLSGSEELVGSAPMT